MFHINIPVLNLSSLENHVVNEDGRTLLVDSVDLLPGRAHCCFGSKFLVGIFQLAKVQIRDRTFGGAVLFSVLGWLVGLFDEFRTEPCFICRSFCNKISLLLNCGHLSYSVVYLPFI